MKLSSKTALGFDPAPVPALVDATGVAYSTPSVHRYSLDGLAGLDWLRADARLAVRLNQATAGGEIVVMLKTANETVFQEAIDLTQGPQDLKARADLSLVSGGAVMFWEVEVTEAADASTEVQCFGGLELESPFVVSGC